MVTCMNRDTPHYRSETQYMYLDIEFGDL
jgi:hypothetical protein